MQYNLSEWLLMHREGINLRIKMDQHSQAHTFIHIFPEVYRDGVLGIVRELASDSFPEMTPEELLILINEDLVYRLTPEMFIP